MGTSRTQGGGGGGDTIRYVPPGDQTYSNNYTIVMAGLEDLAVNEMIVFQYNPGQAFTGTSDPVVITLSGNANDFDETSKGKIRVDNGSGVLRDFRLNDVVRYNIYMLYRAGSFWHLIAGTQDLGS